MMECKRRDQKIFGKDFRRLPLFFKTFLFSYFSLLQLNLTNDYVYGNLKLFSDFCNRRKFAFDNGSI